jgi:hypothetical protein
MEGQENREASAPAALLDIDQILLDGFQVPGFTAPSEEMVSYVRLIYRSVL